MVKAIRRRSLVGKCQLGDKVFFLRRNAEPRCSSFTSPDSNKFRPCPATNGRETWPEESEQHLLL